MDCTLLHGRLLANDRDAFEELATFLTPRMVATISRHFPGVDEQIIWTGVNEALFSYSKRPQLFKGSEQLLSFLLRRAHWRVLDLIRKEQARRECGQPLSEIILEFCRISPPGYVYRVEEAEETERLRQRLMERLSEDDWAVAALLLEEVTGVAPYAEAMRLTHLSLTEQRRQVKRAKDRVRIHLQRAALALGLKPPARPQWNGPGARFRHDGGTQDNAAD